ncbi:C39 family peptidase [Sulfurihydrogenibium sp.]|uniref:C39 family peptidase n=1 Tax=Sulfurihydrogenibium sp. TaxID=2053621 RepID=UPI0026267CCF|nr:C39 family peptidase [Sulfurihydrogenibium sp.]
MKKIILFIFIFLDFSFASNILSVPFVKQKDEYCGPASLSSIFQFYGEKTDQEDIAKFIYNPKLKGALITDLENFAKEKGFYTILKTSDITEIKSFIDEKKPVIALIDLGFWLISKPHYIVIIGYNEKGFIVNTGYKEKEFISYEDFKQKWEKLGKVILVVYK